jgi:hypothetical protein
VIHNGHTKDCHRQRYSLLTIKTCSTLSTTSSPRHSQKLNSFYCSLPCSSFCHVSVYVTNEGGCLILLGDYFLSSSGPPRAKSRVPLVGSAYAFFTSPTSFLKRQKALFTLDLIKSEVVVCNSPVGARQIMEMVTFTNERIAVACTFSRRCQT